MPNILSRKKDSQVAYVAAERLNGKYVRRSDGNRGLYNNPAPAVQNPTRGIPEIDLSETYFEKSSNLVQVPEEPRSNKSKKKLPFLARKKKTSVETGRKATDDIGLSYEDDVSEGIVAYSEVASKETPIPEQRRLNPVVLSQLATLKLQHKPYAKDGYLEDRIQHIIRNYRQPPAYPGHTSIDSRPSILQLLLQEQSSINPKDNASMINYMQVDLPSGLSNEDLTKIMKSFPEEAGIEASASGGVQRDRLVMRTQNKVLDKKSQVVTNTGPISSSQLFEQRQRYYQEHFSNQAFVTPGLSSGNGKRIGEALSEFYPRDYDTHAPSDSYASDSDFSRVLEYSSPLRRTAGGFDSSDYLSSKYALANADDEHTPPTGYLQRRPSQTYVPPSPYLNADIPEWLQVYARASPELDQYLKWDMFRYPELDCWQTMLKRLYKKELEQIVLWFEEYRQALSKELETRFRDMGMVPGKRGVRKIMDPRVRKTNV